MPLEKYREKRSPERTPEPFGAASLMSNSRDSGMFVVQKHSARALHYDFRLAMEGVLRSWAVPRGPSLNPHDKRLAVMVEDHPLEYADFEGTIPEGNYGAGAVIVWDRGDYRVIDPPAGDAATAVRAGKLDIEMHGYKLRGAFTLVRTRGMAQRARRDTKEQWLLIKKRDEHASDNDVLEAHPRSVLSGLTVEEIRAARQTADEAAHELERSGAPPIEAALKPVSFPLALAKTLDDPFDSKDWLFEIKYDGIRALAIRDGAQARIFGRNQREITQRYSEVALALSSLPFERFVFDGEIVAFDDQGKPSFQMLQRRMHVDDREEAQRLSLSMPVIYQVFDLLAFNGFELRNLPLERRKQILGRLIKGEGPVRYCDHIAEHGRAFLEAAAEAQLEGIIAKKRDSPYRGVRTGDWVKIKCPRVANFVIGGWTDPAGARTHFGAILAGQYEADGALRFVARVGSGFDDDLLRRVHARLREHPAVSSPFRPSRGGENAPPRDSHYCAPALVCEVRFSEWTDDGGIRHPVFRRIIEGADPRECVYKADAPARQPSANHRDARASGQTDSEQSPANEHEDRESAEEPVSREHPRRIAAGGDSVPPAAERTFKPTNLGKVFWPAEGYTKGDLIHYYETIAPWMLPYLRDRPVVLTRYPDGIEGKSFFQKDAPGFAPSWIRTVKIYSPDSKREISYFVLESAEALAYMANMGAIPIHIWSSRFPHLERPDWLLFDIDPKNSTTEHAVIVALATAEVLREAGMRPYVKTSGQMGLHVVVGLEPLYTYEQARMFSELVARVVLRRAPESATLIRDHAARKGRAYIDYMQLGYGKTIAGPFAARPVPGAPVSAPLKWPELRNDLDPVKFNIKTMPLRMARLKSDPFSGALSDRQRLEPALPLLEKLVKQ